MAKVLKTVAIIAVAVAVVVFAPQIAGVLASVAGSLGVTVAASAISSALIGMGISMALTAAATMFRKAPSMSQSLVDRLNTSVVPSASRKIVFGTTAGGQDVRFFEGDVDLPSTKKDGYVQVIALASHRISAFKQFYVENDLVWSNGVFLKNRGGFAPNNPLRIVTEGRPGNGFAVGSGRYWNASATFTGCAYYVPFWKLDEEVWESGIPQRLTAIIDGCPLYDPRRDSTRGGSGSHRIDNQDTWAFRDGTVELGRNPALALLTYLIGWRVNGKLMWGMGIPAHRIDFDNFRTYANLCEERVAMQGGDTVQRYTVDGIFSTTDSHETIINGVTATMGSCKLTDRGGTYCLVGGYDDTAGPKIEFTADDLIAPANGSSPYIWNPAPPSRERFNIVRGRFANPDELHQLADWGDPIEREPLADGIPRTLSLDLGAVSRAETCQRIAKQFLLREYLCPGMFSATFGPKAFAVEIGSVITLSLPAEGWNNKLFRVMEQAESHDMFFQMTLREEDPAIYLWDREEKPLPLSIRPQGYDASATISPSNLQLSSASSAGSNGINVSEVHVTWTPEMSGRVNGIQIQSRPAGSEAWTEQAGIFDPKVGTFTFTSNAPGITVEVQARFRMTSAVYSPWVNASVATAPVEISYGDVKDTPDNLSDINPTEGGKLGGIEAGATVGGVIGSNIKNPDGTIYVPPSQGQLVDTTPPAVPTGLTISSTLTDAGATLSASWNAVTDGDLAGYIVAIKQGAGNYIENVVGITTSYERTALPRNTGFTVKVAAYDKAGNRSAFTAEKAFVTERDTVPPAPVTNTKVEATFNSAFVTWTNPDDADLARVEVRLIDSVGQGNTIGVQSIAAAPGTKGSATWPNLKRATTYSCHLLAYDTSGNEAVVTNTGDFTTAGGVAVDDFTPGLQPIQTVTSLPNPAGYTGPSVVFVQSDGKLYRYANGAWAKEVPYSDVTGKPTSLSDINGTQGTKLDGIAAGATVGAPLGTMVGNTPATTVESRANSPATRINEDNVTINGGKITANTIDTNQIKAGAITAGLLRIGSMTELNPDPGFRDTTFWVNDGPYSGALGTSAGSIGGWYNSHGPDINNTLGSTNYCMLWEAYFKGSGRQHLISGRRTSIRAGGIYELSAVCRNASNQRINVLCRMYDVNGNFVSDAALGWNAGDWNVYRTQFTVPNGVNSYCFYVYNDAGIDFLGNCQVTNLQVIEAVASTSIQNGAITTDKLTAGAVTTNKLAINGRQISIAELNLRHKEGVLSWNAANIVYVNDAGDAVYNSVPGGSVTGAGYLCYRPGAAVLEYIGSYSIRANPSYFTICYFDGGTTLAPIANTSTVINGGNIQTDTIDANRIKSKSITAGQIAGGTITGNEVAAGTITAAQIATSALTARTIATGNPDSIVGDSDFRDASWWNSGVADGRLSVNDTGMAENRRELLINPGGGIDIFSMFFPADPGATYRVTYGVYTYGNFSGSFRPMIHIPGIMWMSLKGNGVGMDPSDTNPVHNYTAPEQYYRNSFTFTNWNGPDQGRFQFRLAGSWTGQCSFTVKIVRVSDTTLIKDGAVTTDKITVGTLNGDRITAGTLDASKITANTIGTGQLSVGLQSRTLNNLLNTSFWGSGDMNAVPGWSTNNAGANAWYVGISPTGGAEPLLRMVANTNDANGGWNVAVTTADGFSPNKAYRYYTWYFAESGNNSYYHGTDYVQTMGGGDIGNPYFFAGGKLGLPQGRWLLFVGIVQPAGSTMADSGMSGVWDPISGRRIVAGSDFRWRPGTTTGYFRSYQYYGDVGGVSYYTKPVVEEVVAGQTPSLASLMQQLDYATNINGGSTLIAPGKVLIQGGTSLDSWRDQTEIRGGAIKANTVTAEKIAINARGITALGLDFRYQDGRLWWSEGHVLYTDDNGNASSPYIPAGSVAWAGGSYNYILWDKGAGGFRHVVDAWEQSQNRNANSVIMVTWRNGSNFVANYGGTIVHGDRIVTRTIVGSHIQAGSIGAYEIAANSITADRMSVTSLSAISGNIGSLVSYNGQGGRVERDGNGTRIYDNNGTLRSWSGF